MTTRRNYIRPRDVPTGAALAVLSEGHSRQVLQLDVVFSPGIRSAMWDTSLGTQTAALDMHRGTEASKASFSPDGEYVATVSNNVKGGPVMFWMARDDSCVGVLVLTGHRLGAHRMVFSPNGELLATGGLVRIHEVSNFIPD